MFVVAVMAIVSAITVPQVLAGVQRARAVAGSRYVAQQCGIARLHAVGKARYVAVQFTPEGDDYAMQMFVDGNRNGVRTVDIADGADRVLSARESLSASFPGVRIGLDPALGFGSDPVRLSGTMLLSFSPDGTATAGTVYVLGRDGTQLAVRVLGATGRTRVVRYERATATWTLP